jgi:plastocyanin
MSQQEQGSANTAIAQGSYTVTIKEGASKQSNLLEPFSPAIINVHVGDTVTWVNEDSVNHSINSIAFNSGQMSPKGSESGNPSSSSSFQHTFQKPGVFLYFSKNYSHMAGVVYVDAEETQREIISTTTNPRLTDVKIEMPYNTAYANERGEYYFPVAARVSEGDMITWENHDYIPHTATASDGSFDTDVVLAGGSASITVQGKGMKPYFCEIHPWMQGIVIVS